MTVAVYQKACSKNVSGNSKIFVAEAANVSAITVTAGEISAITGAEAFKEIQVELDTIVRTEEKIAGKLNHTFDVSINMKLAHPSKDLNTLRNSLVSASPCGMLALVRDHNGEWWLVGYNELDLVTRPLFLAQDNMTTGAELIDIEGNKASLILSRSLADASLPLDATLAAAMDAQSAAFADFIAGWGVDVVVNGDFASDTVWGKGTGVTISAGKANLSSATAGAAALTQAGILTIGKDYKITFTISDYSAGVIQLRAGTTYGAVTYTANGTYEEIILCGGGTGFAIYNFTNPGTLKIDDVSALEEV